MVQSKFNNRFHKEEHSYFESAVKETGLSWKWYSVNEFIKVEDVVYQSKGDFLRENFDLLKRKGWRPSKNCRQILFAPRILPKKRVKREVVPFTVELKTKKARKKVEKKKVSLRYIRTPLEELKSAVDKMIQTESALKYRWVGPTIIESSIESFKNYLTKKLRSRLPKPVGDIRQNIFNRKREVKGVDIFSKQQYFCSYLRGLAISFLLDIDGEVVSLSRDERIFINRVDEEVEFVESDVTKIRTHSSLLERELGEEHLCKFTDMGEDSFVDRWEAFENKTESNIFAEIIQATRRRNWPVLDALKINAVSIFGGELVFSVADKGLQLVGGEVEIWIATGNGWRHGNKVF